MSLDLLPYFFLLLALLSAACTTKRPFALLFLAIGIFCALFLKRMSFVALPSILLLFSSLYFARQDFLNKNLKGILYGAFFLLAVALSMHSLPGFYNLKVFQSVQFSEDSIPFSMYLNFDKFLAGFTLYFFVLRFERSKVPVLSVSIKTLIFLLCSMLPLALLSNYVRWDPKLPPDALLWALNNFFFVCLAEEALFRGFIQKNLLRVFSSLRGGVCLSVLISAFLFGLAHYKGGVPYVILASFAGLFYGYAYWKSGRIEGAMIVHFGLNFLHFFFFSYPALMRVD